MRSFIPLMSILFFCGMAFAQTPASKDSPVVREEAPLPEKIHLSQDPADAPTVSIRKQDNGDIVEEYRQNGRLTMVKVTPPNGIPYTLLDTNGDGLLDKTDSEGPIGPVYYTLYRWN